MIWATIVVIVTVHIVYDHWNIALQRHNIVWRLETNEHRTHTILRCPHWETANLVRNLTARYCMVAVVFPHWRAIFRLRKYPSASDLVGCCDQVTPSWRQSASGEPRISQQQQKPCCDQIVKNKHVLCVKMCFSCRMKHLHKSSWCAMNQPQFCQSFCPVFRFCTMDIT